MTASPSAPPSAYMAKKKPKATLYVEIDKSLKDRIDAIAERNGRKLNSEVARALEFYLAAQEKADDDGGA
jgi:predicted transcriptional regulator